MTGYQGFTNTPHERAAYTTMARHFKKVEPAMLRATKALGLVEKAGGVEFNSVSVEMAGGGEGFTWPVEMRLPDVVGNTGEGARPFTRDSFHDKAAIEFRGYQSTAMMYKKEFLSNRGPSAVVNIYGTMGRRLEMAMKQAFGTKVYKNGNLTNTDWHGFETLFEATQTIQINAAGATGRTANVLDLYGYPDGEYANIVTDLGGAQGGSNESGLTWPDGLATPQFDFWSALILNYTSTELGASNTWAEQADLAIARLLDDLARNALPDGQPTVCLLARNLWTPFKNLHRDKERIQITDSLSLRALGFRDVIEFDGVEVSTDPGVPSSVGYVFNPKCIRMRVLTDRLIDLDKPEYRIEDQSYLWAADTHSNMEFRSPRNFGKLVSLAG